MRKLEWTKKIIVIVLGSIVAAYGITLAMYAGFGDATLAVLWQGIAQTFHISIGMASMVIALLMIALYCFTIDRNYILEQSCIRLCIVFVWICSRTHIYIVDMRG